MNKQTVVAGLLFLAFGFLIFYPALSLGFVSDDFVWLKESQNPQQFDPFDSQSLAFTKGRPGTMALFLILHKLFSADAGKFHFVMLVFHILNAVLLFIILRHFKLPFSFSLLTSLIFLVHFSNEETLFWVSCLSSIFCLFFYLVAVLFYLKDLKDPTFLLKTAILGFSLGALSIREDALTLPLILLSLDFIDHRTEGIKIGSMLKRNLIFFVPSIVYLGYRLMAAFQNSMGYAFSLNPVMWVQDGRYFLLNMLFPLQFIFDRLGYEMQAVIRQKMMVPSYHRLWVIGGGLLVSAVVFLTVKFRRKISGPLKFGGFLSLVGFLPYLPLLGNTLRFLYFALVGGAILGAGAVLWLSGQVSKNRRELIAAVFGIAFIGLSFLIIQERSQWWIKSSQTVIDILKQTEKEARSLLPGESLYVVNLPRRLNGAHIFHKGGYAEWSPFKGALALTAPEIAGKVHDLGDKNLNELKEFKGKKVYTFENGKLKELMDL